MSNVFHMLKFGRPLNLLLISVMQGLPSLIIQLYLTAYAFFCRCANTLLKKTN